MVNGGNKENKEDKGKKENKGNDRYIRQITLAQVGEEGQRLISKARIAVIGLGALGSASSELLTRAGVGFLRIVDRDYVNLNNLQRCLLYTEQDAEQSLPKAIAAKQHLCAINSEITIEEISTDVNPSTIETLIQDVDFVVDATDNFTVRYLLNDCCHKLDKTWVYAGVLAGFGAMMVIPPSGPCFRCLSPQPPSSGNSFSCATVGVLASIPAILASLQVAAVISLILGEQLEAGKYVTVDAWNLSFDEISIEQDPRCPCCVKAEYEYLEKASGLRSVELCGQDEYQILPAQKLKLDLAEVAQRLRTLGTVTVNPCILSFEKEEVHLKLFVDGRAMIKGAIDEEDALSIYSEYIGL